LLCRLPAKLPPSQYWLYLSGRKILATRLPSQRSSPLDGFGIAMLMPSGDIARYSRRRSISPIKISRLAHRRGAAILHRITKCPRPVTLLRWTAPFMRLWDGCGGVTTRLRDCRRPLRALLVFVSKLLRFDEPRVILSLGSARGQPRARRITTLLGWIPGAINECVRLRARRERPALHSACAGLLGM
jgi:hypothetical protein